MPERDDLTDAALVVVASWRALEAAFEPLLVGVTEAGHAAATMGDAVDALARVLDEQVEQVPTPAQVETGPGQGAVGAARNREQRRAEKMAQAKAMAESGE